VYDICIVCTITSLHIMIVYIFRYIFAVTNPNQPISQLIFIAKIIHRYKCRIFVCAITSVCISKVPWLLTFSDAVTNPNQHSVLNFVVHKISNICYTYTVLVLMCQNSVAWSSTIVLYIHKTSTLNRTVSACTVYSKVKRHSMIAVVF